MIPEVLQFKLIKETKNEYVAAVVEASGMTKAQADTISVKITRNFFIIGPLHKRCI